MHYKRQTENENAGLWRLAYRALPVNIPAEGVTLADYLQQVITNRPIFTKQALPSAIELQQQQRSLGDEDRGPKVGSRVIQSRDNEQNARLAMRPMRRNIMNYGCVIWP